MVRYLERKYRGYYSGMESLYAGCRAYVEWGRGMGGYFKLERSGERNLMSSWHFNVFSLGEVVRRE